MDGIYKGIWVWSNGYCVIVVLSVCHSFCKRTSALTLKDLHCRLLKWHICGRNRLCFSLLWEGLIWCVHVLFVHIHISKIYKKSNILCFFCLLFLLYINPSSCWTLTGNAPKLFVVSSPTQKIITRISTLGWEEFEYRFLISRILL